MPKWKISLPSQIIAAGVCKSMQNADNYYMLAFMCREQYTNFRGVQTLMPDIKDRNGNDLIIHFFDSALEAALHQLPNEEMKFNSGYLRMNSDNTAFAHSPSMMEVIKDRQCRIVTPKYVAAEHFLFLAARKTMPDSDKKIREILTPEDYFDVLSSFTKIFELG